MADGMIHDDRGGSRNLDVDIGGKGITGGAAGTEHVEKPIPPGGLGAKGRYQDILEEELKWDETIGRNIYANRPELPLPRKQETQSSFQTHDNFPPGTDTEMQQPQQTATFHEQSPVDMHKLSPDALGITTAQDSMLTDEKSKTEKAKSKKAQESQTGFHEQKPVDMHKLSPDALGVTTAQDSMPADQLAKSKKAKDNPTTNLPKPQEKALKGGIEYMQDMQKVLTKKAAEGKGDISDFSLFTQLQMISAALSKAKQTLAEMEKEKTDGKKDTAQSDRDKMKALSTQVSESIKDSKDKAAAQQSKDSDPKHLNLAAAIGMGISTFGIFSLIRVVEGKNAGEIFDTKSQARRDTTKSSLDSKDVNDAQDLLKKISGELSDKDSVGDVSDKVLDDLKQLIQLLTKMKEKLVAMAAGQVDKDVQIPSSNDLTAQKPQLTPPEASKSVEGTSKKTSEDVKSATPLLGAKKAVVVGSTEQSSPPTSSTATQAKDAAAIPGLGSIVPTPGSPAEKMLAGAEAYLKDIHTVVSKYANQHKDDPFGVSLFEALSEVSAALSNAKSLLYEISTRNIMQRKDVSDAQWDSQRAQVEVHKAALEKQREQQAEIAKKQEKSNKVNAILKVLGPIAIALTVLATIASFGTLGPIAIALSVALMASQISGAAGGTDFMQVGIQKMSEGISYLIKNVIGPIIKAVDPSAKQEDINKWCDVVGQVIAIAIIVECAASPKAGMAFTLNLTSQLMASTSVVSNFLVDCGVSKDKADIAGAAVTAFVGLMAAGVGMYKAAAQRAETIARIQAAIAATRNELATLPEVVGSIPRAILKLQLCVQESCLRFLKNIEFAVRSLKADVDLVTATGGMFIAVYQKNIYDAQAKLKEIKADEDIMSMKLDDIIEALKAVIKQLQKAFDALLQGLVQIDRLQIKKYDVAKVQWSSKG